MTKNKQIITLSIDKEVVKEFKTVCNKHYITYSMLISLLMRYALSLDKEINIIEYLNQELIQ